MVNGSPMGWDSPTEISWGIFIGVEKKTKIQTFEPNEPCDIQVTYVLAYHGFPNKAGC